MPDNKKTFSQKAEIPAYRTFFTAAITALVFFGIFAARLQIESLMGDSADLFGDGSGIYADWFLACKENFYFILACIAGIYTAGERVIPDKPCHENPLFRKKALPLLVFSGIYLAGNCISAIFSSHREVVINGICTEHEGLKAIFSYTILFLFGFNFISYGKIADIYKKLLLAVTAAASVLAALEYLTKPLMTLPFMKYLIASKEYRELAAQISPSNTFREAVLMFNNSNYTGGFFALVFPITLYFVFSAEKTAAKIIYLILTALAFSAGIMSNSTAAFYIILTEIIFITVFMLFKKMLPLGKTASAAGIFIATALIVNFSTGNDFAANIVKNIFNSGTYSETSDIYRIESIAVEGEKIRINGKDSEYFIYPPIQENSQLKVTGSESTMFSMEKKEDNIFIHDMASNTNLNISLNSGILYIDAGYKHTIDFAVTTKGIKAIVQNTKLISEIPQSPFAGTFLEKYYGFATGRGYIWINSLPILKKCIIIGRGTGNFPFEFIQNDIAGLSNTHGTYHMIVDKPHSWYLQTAISGGIPVLIAMLILFGHFVFGCFSLLANLRKDDFSEDRNKIFMLCIFTGIAGFMVTGLVNDSIITVSPFFWLNFGAAYSLFVSMKKGEKYD